MRQFNVIDSDSRRRAQIARQLISNGFHAEIYEDLDEFLRSDQTSGVVLANNAGGCRLTDTIAKGEIAAPVVLYSEQPSPSEIVDAVNAGAVDFLEWPFRAGALDRLTERLETISGRKAAEIRKRGEAQARVDKLSNREREVLALIVQGASSKGIGEDLGISHRTVEIHRANVLSKLEARSTADAVRIAVYAGVDEAVNLGAGMDAQREDAEAA